MQLENSTLWTLNFWKNKYQNGKNWAATKNQVCNNWITSKLQQDDLQKTRRLQETLYNWHDDYNYGNYDNMVKFSESTKQKAEVKR